MNLKYVEYQKYKNDHKLFQNQNIVKNQRESTHNVHTFKFYHRLIHCNIKAYNTKLVLLNVNLVCRCKTVTHVMQAHRLRNGQHYTVNYSSHTVNNNYYCVFNVDNNYDLEEERLMVFTETTF